MMLKKSYIDFIWRKETNLFTNPPIGNLVDVDGEKMNVYTYGEGDDTLVFLAGAFITSPILDFKDFTDQLKDDYKIVVIEKFGYGFSDITDDDRITDTMVEQSRKALTAAGIDGPYILCPHSFSGLEAIYWAQHYPEEIKAIIGFVLCQMFQRYFLHRMVREQQEKVERYTTSLHRFKRKS